MKLYVVLRTCNVTSSARMTGCDVTETHAGGIPASSATKNAEGSGEAPGILGLHGIFTGDGAACIRPIGHDDGTAVAVDGSAGIGGLVRRNDAVRAWRRPER